MSATEIDIGYQSVVDIHNHTLKSYKKLKLNDVVIHDNNITIRITYPLKIPATFDHSSDTCTGFTRKQLAKIIARDYHRVYDEEKESQLAEPQKHPMLINRGTSNGKYGIWGHDIGDLILHTAVVNNENGQIIVDVDCDS